MLAQLAGLSILARALNSTGNVAALTAFVALSYLRLNAAGTSLEWGTLPAGPTGSGASGQIAYWTGASTQDGDVSFLYDVTTFRMQINGTWIGCNANSALRSAHWYGVGQYSGDAPARRYLKRLDGNTIQYPRSGSGSKCDMGSKSSGNFKRRPVLGQS